MSDFSVLESVLRPLSYWYNQDNLEEVAINRSGQIWLRMRGKRAYPWVMYKDEKLSKEYLTDLLYIIANTYELEFDPIQGSPFVYATIPGDHRFSAICGKNVMYDEDDLTGGIALAIRLHSDDVAFGLEDYGMKQGQALMKLNPLKDIKVPDDAYERLLLYIKRGEHILVSGATSTGKTTFLNNLLKILDIHKRIITVEDTRELIVPHPNRVHLVMSRTNQTNDINYSGIIDLVVRFTPDAIIGGEISTSNASGIWVPVTITALPPSTPRVRKRHICNLLNVLWPRPTAPSMWNKRSMKCAVSCMWCRFNVWATNVPLPK